MLDGKKMSEFPKNVQMMLEEIKDLNVKQIYIYLKSGTTLFMGGTNFEIKAVKAGILVAGLRETSIISWGSIAGVKVLKEIESEEEEIIEEEDEQITEMFKELEKLDGGFADDGNYNEDAIPDI
jgi:hypothetical protein